MLSVEYAVSVDEKQWDGSEPGLMSVLLQPLAYFKSWGVLLKVVPLEVYLTSTLSVTKDLSSIGVILCRRRTSDTNNLCNSNKFFDFDCASDDVVALELVNSADSTLIPNSMRSCAYLERVIVSQLRRLLRKQKSKQLSSAIQTSVKLCSKGI